MLNISRVAVLPEVKEANTVYLVADGTDGLQVVITGSTAAVIKSTRTTASISNEITAAVTAAAGGSTTALNEAVNTLTTMIVTETDNRVAGDTAVRADFASADASIRADFAAADTAMNAAITTSLADNAAASTAYSDAKHTAALAAVTSSAATVTSGYQAADAALQSTLQANIDTVEDEAAANLSAAVTTVTSTLMADSTSKANAAQAAAIAHADALVAGLDMTNSALYALDITARDALEAGMTKNSFVMVADASADPTVDAGSALYFRNVSTSTWTKVAEYESMDITIPNLSILADLGDSNGLLTYKGALVATVQHVGSEW